MPNNGLSASDTVRLAKMNTLARFKQLNPDTPDTGNKAQSANTLLLREVGTAYGSCPCPPCEPVCDVTDAAFYIDPFVESQISFVEEFVFFWTGGISITIPPPPPGYDTSIQGFLIIYMPICNATNYTETMYDDLGLMPTVVNQDLGIFSQPGNPSNQAGFIVIWPSRQFSDPITFLFTASNECSSKTTETSPGGCFIAGSKVSMSDGSLKDIETVQVGEKVLGAFGETNRVLGLHRPMLGYTKLININGEHTTTAHHPHIGADKSFLTFDCSGVQNKFYGKNHKIINGYGVSEMRAMTGVAECRMKHMEVGCVLQTVTGPKAIAKIDDVTMSPFTRLYHLVVSGSHTFCVDGYAVTGWADETDFDYDDWKKIKSK